MTRKEMLEKSGLTEQEFFDLTHKFRTFSDSLNQAQRAAVARSLPTMNEAAASFGPTVTAEKLDELFGIDCSGGGDTFVSERGVGLSAKAE
jgi:hypothetical protein